MTNCAQQLTTEVEEHIKYFNNPSKKVVLKEEKIKSSVESTHVSTLKHKVKQRLTSRKRLFVCFLKQLKTAIATLKTVV